MGRSHLQQAQVRPGVNGLLAPAILGPGLAPLLLPIPLPAPVPVAPAPPPVLVLVFGLGGRGAVLQADGVQPTWHLRVEGGWGGGMSTDRGAAEARQAPGMKQA